MISNFFLQDDEVEETEEYEDLEEIETLPIPAGYSMPYESEEDHGERHKRGLKLKLKVGFF